MEEKVKQEKQRNRLTAIILFFLLLVLIAWFSEESDQSGEKCRVDGTGIVPISRVLLVNDKGDESIFCSLCCAKVWLESHGELAEQLASGKASLTVVDEISGQAIDASLAYWIKSEEYSRAENRCQLHVFSDKKAAAKYLRQQQGTEFPGYLAGLGQQLPWAVDFSLEDIYGQLHTLTEYRGKIVFLRFWSLGNPFVETDLRNLQEAQERFQEQGFTVVAVNVEDRKEEALSFVGDLELSFPVLLDPEGKVADQYQVTGFPTGFLLDQSGIVESSTIGELTADVLAPFLHSLR